jgi:hypothetical protein
MSTLGHVLAGTAGVKDTVFGDALKVDGSRVDLVRFLLLIEKAPRTSAIVTN